ncbi:MAG: pentapeptide repeat-containing protein, partial [bacterium]
DALKSVEETSKNARGILLALVAICSFALLTATTITDLQLVLNGTRLKLPIINTEVPVIPFSVSVPILGLLVFIYLHMYLAHLHELLADLPALFPDGVPLRRKLYPWMMNLLIEEWQFPSTEEEWQLTRIKDKSITHKTLMDRLIDLLAIWFRFNRFRSMFAILLGWALLPMTSFTIAYRFLARHDSTLSYILLGLSTFSVFIASLVYQRARATVKSEKVGLLRGLTPIVLSTIILFAGLKVTNSGINGELPGTTQNMSFSNLANKELRRINLRKADLRGADLSNTDLHSADLFNANLKGAYLGDARLDSANLEGADLRGAKGLTAEQLYKAKTLFDAKLESTLLEQIRKEYPDLLKKIRSSEQ